MNKGSIDHGLIYVGTTNIHQMVTKSMPYFTDSKIHIFHILSELIIDGMLWFNWQCFFLVVHKIIVSFAINGILELTNCGYICIRSEVYLCFWVTLCHRNELIKSCVNLNLEQVVSLATFSGLKSRFSLLLFF